MALLQFGYTAFLVSLEKWLLGRYLPARGRGAGRAWG